MGRKTPHCACCTYPGLLLNQRQKEMKEYEEMMRKPEQAQHKSGTHANRIKKSFGIWTEILVPTKHVSNMTRQKKRMRC